jgi:quercetin 2,3-dioxygenase
MRAPPAFAFCAARRRHNSGAGAMNGAVRDEGGAVKAVKGIHAAERDDVADLITYRAMPTAAISMRRLDPFLLLNHHGPQVYPPGNRGLPFGPHPHRGFETVTFIVAGDLVHSDTGGHVSAVGAGGVQWMTAGRGLEHAELSSDEFKAKGGALEILQLWVNLPARLKMTEPRYVGLQSGDIPNVRLDDERVVLRPVSGDWEGVAGPVGALTDVHLATIALEDGAFHELSVPSGRTVLLYVVRGAVDVNGSVVSARHLAELNRGDGAVFLSAVADSLVLFGHATPFGEPVASYGPFVMNTRDEIDQAIRDYRAGTFGTW